MVLTMSRPLIILAIICSYFIFAILLNSVGTVILQSINSFDVSKSEASVLEGFKDLSIAFVSFFVASLVPRIGYKVALLIGLGLSALACLAMPQLATFWGIKLLFASIGVSFALVKISVYSLIGQICSDTRQHSSLLNTVEGVFMLGVLSGYWIFSGYIDVNNSASLDWLEVYYLLGGVLFAVALTVYIAPIQPLKKNPDEKSVLQEFVGMLQLTYRPLVLVFVISIFMYVLIEQGIGTWLPTFNNEMLGLPVDVSVQITSVFAAMIAIGRLAAGQILRFVHWYPFLNVCLILMGALILLSLPLAQPVQANSVTSILDVPAAAYLLPIVGLMMAPVYPVLNSIMLSSLEITKHAPMTGLIVVFSALGGTTGSIITGVVFDRFGGHAAFYLTLIPIMIIIICLMMFKKITDNGGLTDAQ